MRVATMDTPNDYLRRLLAACGDFIWVGQEGIYRGPSLEGNSVFQPDDDPATWYVPTCILEPIALP